MATKSPTTPSPTAPAGPAGAKGLAPPGPPGPAPDATPVLVPLQWLTLALLAAATLAVFAGAVRNGWTTWDDPHYVFNNPHVNHGWRLDNAVWFLSHAHNENWHPLTSWSHMLDVQLFGLAPAGHHAVSVLFHVLNAVLLVIVLYRMTGAWWRSMLVGALFALHPLRVESVAWIAERKDVLSGLFFLLTLEAYRRWAARPDRGRYAALVAAFVLGLMSKPMLVTLPFVLVLLDVWPLGRLTGLPRNPATRAPARTMQGLLVEKWPLFALSAASSVVTFFVQRQGGAVISVEMAAPARRICNAVVSYWRYVEKTAWPRDLAFFYPYSRHTEYVAAAIVAAGLVAVTALFLWQARRRPYLVVGWFWYVGMLVPVIGLLQVGSQAYADRYTYLPTIGLLVALVWFVGERVGDSRPGRVVAAGASVLVLAALSVLTVRQVTVWKDTRRLFEHALAVTQENLVAHEKLGEALILEGKTQLAIQHFNEALRLQPEYADAHVNLANALGTLGRYEEAVEHFRRGLSARGTANGHTNLGLTLAKLGRMDEAIVEYQAALQIEPDRAVTLVQLGTALGAKGRFSEAATYLQRAVDTGEAPEDTRSLLAATLVRAGQVEEAIRAYGVILRRHPDDLDALNNVAWIRATHADASHRNGAEAVRLAERAREKSPEPVAVIYSTLAAAYAEAGRFPEAVQTCERAIALAKGAGQAQEAATYAQQLRRYRAGKPFHFGE